ncbi:MAG: response regulator [Planktothrix sp. GU0601_MAG3]|nr:MAG: response regulator [Planktothrix sp. GU0601_MAG3]
MKDLDFILIVDDNPTNLSVLSQTLKGAGFAVRVAEDGESALQLVERKQPTLILLDVQMPGIDGFETCKKLKADPKNQEIPIIFLTALTDVKNKVKGLSLGAVDYISKPFEQEEVLARVRVHLQLKNLTETLEQRVAERTAVLEQAQVQLVQQEKLSSLGQLVTGIAHEMNNPISCIVNNIPPAQEYFRDINHILNLCKTHYQQLPKSLQNAIIAADLDFVLDDLNKLLTSIKLSTTRIQDISISLRNFARF